MRCPYCQGPLCRVTSLAEEKKSVNALAIVWRCIVCGADTLLPKANRRSYNEQELLALLNDK